MTDALLVIEVNVLHNIWETKTSHVCEAVMNEQSICVLWFAIKQATYVSNGRYMVVFQHGTACTPAHQAPGRGAWDRSQPDLHSTVH